MEDRFKKFTILINKIIRSIHKIKSDEMGRLGLKSTHVSCLYYLYREGEMTAKELCDICEEDKGAISRAIEFLEEQGYLICSSKTEKRYKSPINLSDKGKEVGAFICNKVDGLLEKASQGLSEEKRKIFYESLHLIANNLQKLCDK